MSAGVRAAVVAFADERDVWHQRERFDTFLIGRKTFQVMQAMGSAAPPTPGIRSIVFSRATP